MTLALGIGFFLKLSFDNNWIGETGRIALGLAAGAGLLALGEYTRQRAAVWAQAVTAGGAATLYMSIYAAYVLYELIRPDLAFLALGGVVALAGALAIRLDSRVIGFLGIVGAFIAPILLGPELPDVRLVLPYIAIVDLGILGVASVRNWRWFTIAGWIGSYGLFAAGYNQYPETDPLLFQAGLTVIFLIFVGATTLFHIIWRRVPGSLDMALVAVNATAYLALTAMVLSDAYSDWLWVIASAMAILYGAISFVAYTRPGAPPQTAMITLPIALVFLTLSIPLALTGVWLMTAWAAQGVVLVWSGFVLGRLPMRVFGLGALALSAMHLLNLPPDVEIDDFSVLLNEHFGVAVFVIGAVYAAAYLYHRNRDSSHEKELPAAATLMAAASVLTLVTLSREAVFFYGLVPEAIADWQVERNEVSPLLITLTWIWAVYAAGLLVLGLARNKPLARWGGLALVGLVFVKLVLVDSFIILPEVDSHIPVLNSKFLSFVVAAAPVAAIGYVYRDVIRNLVEQETAAFRALFAATNVLAVWALTVEIVHFFSVREERLDIDQGVAIMLALTVIWALYGTALLAAGLWKNLALARQGGLGLLGLAIVKIVLLDTFALLPDAATYTLVLNWHFGANVVTVAAIAVVAFAFRERIRNLSYREGQIMRWLPVAAGGLALWSMSLEAIHYFSVQEELLGTEQDSAMHLTLTVLWAVYGVVVIAAGFLRDESRIRLAGMALLAVPVIKLFVFDVFLLEQVYRVAAFVTLGALLLGAGLAYQRYSAEFKGFLLGRQDERG